MAIGLNEFKCASRFLSQPDIIFIDRAPFRRLIPRSVSRRGHLDPGATGTVPLRAPETMVVGRFFCFPRSSESRCLRAW